MSLFGKSDFKARLFLSDNQERTVSSFIGDSHATPGNVGVCLSGGGSRALTCGMGQLRALKELQVNGKSLLGQVKAVSTVSGGSWVGVPFLYLDEETSDDDYLNRYVEDQSRLVATKTGGHDLSETLDEFPPNNIGQGPAERSFSPLVLAFCALILHKLYKVPADMLWQTLVGTHILKPYELYNPSLLGKKPTTFFSYDLETLNRDILDQNPDLRDEIGHLYVNADAQRVHRPFLICNMSMFVSLPGYPDKFLVPVQVTPFFTGVVGDPKGAVDANNQFVGGGGVTSFGFNSQLLSVTNANVELEQNRSWALVDAVGVSSSFFAEKVNEIFNEMKKNPSLIKTYREKSQDAVNTWINKILPNKKFRLAGAVLDEVEQGFDKIGAELISDSEIIDILDDIDDIVPKYLYWPAKSAKPDSSLKPNSFADGGNLENTGVASLLAYHDIDNVMAFVNTSTPMTESEKGVLDENGHEIPGTRIFVDSQMPPLFGYRPYREGLGYQLYSAADTTDADDQDFSFSQVFESSAFADFLTKMWTASGNAEKPGSNQRPAICEQTLRVLDNTWFGVKGRGGAGDAKGKINIVWYYNNRARDWYDQLNDEVKDLLGNFDDASSFHNFPHYSTLSSHLSETEINLLANYTAWAVADSSNSGTFTRLFSESH